MVPIRVANSAADQPTVMETLGALADLGENIAALLVRAKGQGFGLHHHFGLELGSASSPFPIARRQGVHVADVTLGPLPTLHGILRVPSIPCQQSAVRGTPTLPVLGNQAQRAAQHHHDEQA